MAQTTENFSFVSADGSAVLFTLDRGVVVQEGGRVAPHVVLELRVGFKPQSEGLEVTAWEEVVADFPSSRQRVRSPKELENLQRLLDKIRADLEAQSAGGDSGIKRDSSSP